MTPTAITETLDTRGLLDDARGPGTYALRVETPDTVKSVARAFLEVGDACPPDGALERLTNDRVAYVGASTDVYTRLMDHAEGKVRQATFLEAFNPVGVVGVWPESDPFDAEYNRAVELSRQGWTVWCDGRTM